MHELRIAIGVAEGNKQNIENSIDDITRDKYFISDENRFKQINLLREWEKAYNRLQSLNELRETIMSNKKIEDDNKL